MRTAHRYLITTYGGQREKEDPLQDLYQVNVAGPTGWVSVSSIILWHQRAQGHGSKLTNVISLSLLLLVALLYVDYGKLLEAAHSGKK